MARSINERGGSAEIIGLRDFTRALKEVGDKYPDKMRDANYQAAEQISLRARAIASAQGGVARKASESLRASRTLNYAAIRLGSAKFPFALGAEFGALRYRQFKAWRGNQWGGWEGGPGYFLHPAIRQYGPAVIADYFTKLEALHKQAFPE